MIRSEEIGEGLYIEHGFASAIGAKSIGKNCLINQQVTITEGVTIMDNVTIRAGAVIIREVKIGNNSVIGANSTVFKDVPDNCTVLPGTSKFIQWSKTKLP